MYTVNLALTTYGTIKGQTLEEKVQRGHHYAIVDEVDSILIDEARTPLIIAEPQGEPVELYKKIDAAVRRLQSKRHYERDEKSSKRGTVALTEEGVEEIERLLGGGRSLRSRKHELGTSR